MQGRGELEEQQYTIAREQLFAAMGQGVEPTLIIQALNEAFSRFPDITTHGVILWALMKKTSNGVSGEHFKVYLQYYYHYLARCANRIVNRPLYVHNLAFLTCTACLGYRQGCAEFDSVLKADNLPALNTYIITRDNFLTFFWADTTDKFSFLSCWRIINNLWDLWNQVNPIRLLGFTSDVWSFSLLSHHMQNHGVFLFRFSSQGGLSVDYIEKENPQVPQLGKFKKVLWKEDAIPDVKSFMNELYTGRISSALLYLVNSTSPEQVYNKADVFSVAQVVSQLGTGAYNQVIGGATDGMATEPTPTAEADQNMSVYSRLMLFDKR